jgi:hypothetical protein
MTDKVRHIALYRTSGRRQEKHCCVLYLAVDRDWGSLQLHRNGHRYGLLAAAPMTPEALAYCDARHRASSLQYTGQAPADSDGLAADLAALGYDDETVRRFVFAALPCWPTVTIQSVLSLVTPSSAELPRIGYDGTVFRH